MTILSSCSGGGSSSNSTDPAPSSNAANSQSALELESDLTSSRGLSYEDLSAEAKPMPSFISTSSDDVNWLTLKDAYPKYIRDQYSPKTSIRLFFVEEINTSTVTKDNFKLRNVSQDIFPEYDLTYRASDNSVWIKPKEHFEYSDLIEFLIAKDVRDIDGRTMRDTYKMQFRIEDTDTTGPVLQFSEPESNSFDISVSQEIRLSFDELLDSTRAQTSNKILRRFGEREYVSRWLEVDNYLQPVETSVYVEGSVMVVKPSQPLKYEDNYSLRITKSNGLIANEFGVESTITTPITFSTALYPDVVETGQTSAYLHALDSKTNRLYSIDRNDKELIEIDLSTDTVLRRETIAKEAIGICLESEADILHIAYNFGLIIEYDINTFEQLNIIRHGPDALYGHFKGVTAYVNCSSESVYAAGMDGYSGLVKSTRGTNDHENLPTLPLSQDYYFAANGDIVAMEEIQYGQHQLVRYRFSGDDYQVVDRTELAAVNGTPGFARIFSDMQETRLFSKNLVLNFEDMSDILHEFPEPETIMAIDWINQRLFTQLGVYSLEDYDLIEYLPVSEIDEIIVDIEGDAYIWKNARGGYYRMNSAQFAR